MVGDPLADLDGRIKEMLQGYLGTPIEDRSRDQYMALVQNLTRAAMAYSRGMIEERVENQRLKRKMIGGKHL